MAANKLLTPKQVAEHLASVATTGRYPDQNDFCDAWKYWHLQYVRRGIPRPYYYAIQSPTNDAEDEDTKNRQTLFIMLVERALKLFEGEGEPALVLKEGLKALKQPTLPAEENRKHLVAMWGVMFDLAEELDTEMADYPEGAKPPEFAGGGGLN